MIDLHGPHVREREPGDRWTVHPRLAGEVQGQGARRSLARRGSREPSSRTLTSSTRQPGTWGAGHALHWDGEDIATGNVGGGFWYGSSHSTNLACVGTFLQYATSGPQSVKLITGLPAYASTASDVVGRAGRLAGTGPTRTRSRTSSATAANNIWPGWGATLSFSSEPAWAEIVAPALASGKTIASSRRASGSTSTRTTPRSTATRS